MTSFTVAFTGSSSVLQADFFPEIMLEADANYYCALLDFTSYNSIPNITEGRNNELLYICTEAEGGKSIALPTGAYEVEDILRYLKMAFAEDNISLEYEISAATSKVQISFDRAIERQGGTVLDVIGFRNNSERSRVFERHQKYRSEQIVRITNIDIIRIECDIASGAYVNGKACHTIHQFSHCKVGTGHKFIEVPKHIVYLPVKGRGGQLRSIQISIVDQDDNLIDFRGEQISCRIHIKKFD